MRAYTIVVSTADAASVNIRDNLFKLAAWEKIKDSPYHIYRTEGFELVEIADYHVFQDGLDTRLEAAGHKPDTIIFASKHRSKEARKTLTVHHTGNIGENKFGGRPFELAMAAPRTAASILKNLKVAVTEYNVSYEATHHGPSDLRTPSVYVEIGSTMEQWCDLRAGATIAKAIMDVKEDEHMPSFVGIGGNHYAPRETALTLETGACFGHILPDHAIADVNEDILRQAFEKTGTRYAYLDKKSIPKEHRVRIEELISKLGFEIQPESEIRTLAMPWLKCPRLKDIAGSKEFQSRPQFTESLQAALAHCDPGACGACPMGIEGRVNDTLLSMAWNVDKTKVQELLNDEQIAYFYYSNGCPAGIFFGIDKSAIEDATKKVTDGCVDVLKEKYEVKYDHWEEILYIIDRRLDPEKAKELGVPEGPLYGRLARGEAVTVKGTTITPQMVYAESVKRIKLNNYAHNIREGDGVMEPKEPSIFSLKTARKIDDHGEIIDSEERQSSIIDGEKPAVQPDKVGDTDEDIMEVMKSLKTNVLVLGCGGGGSNSISRMAMEGITGAQLYALNTDAQHLLHTKADKKFLIGKKLTRGFGAGSLPEVGESAAKESLGEIKAAIQRSDMVFVTCGLGGGTGTGSAPVVAQAAKEGGALTIAVVTTPFKVEGAVRKANADRGLAKLRQTADTVIVVPNDKLLEVVPNLPMQAAFKVADEVLTHAVKGITELVTKSGLVNLDFADIKTVMSNGGVAMIGLGEGKGEDAALKSVAAALESPLLDIDISGATAAIVNVTGGDQMTISEAESVVEEVYGAIDQDARLIWGASVDPELGEVVRTMVIITGVKSNQILGKTAPEPVPVIEAEQKTLKSQKFGIDFVG